MDTRPTLRALVALTAAMVLGGGAVVGLFQ
jgi:hypothetical protein